MKRFNVNFLPHYFLPAGGPLKEGKHFNIFEVNKIKFKESKTKQGKVFLLHFAIILNLQEEGFHVDF